MPQFVRAALRTNRWLETKGLQPPNFPADVITDLRTQGDELSVYEVSQEVSAERIAIALAAGKQKPEETGYAVFDRAIVVGLGINAKKKSGTTIDTDVNGCHFDLPIGTVSKLLELAGVMATGEIIPILRKTVEERLKEGLKSGQLDGNKMNESLKGKLVKKEERNS